ncbi:MAG: hypothetical protein IKG11_09745 [Atopobiaceae bacterium]|nr:hypothetical protein [Atopobiaceae bacterium]
MLHRDYLLEIIAKFVDAVTVALRGALLDGSPESARDVEDSVAALLDLDPQTAMNLSPDSLVTMMLLSGMGDSLASYVSYALDRVGDAYDDMGDRAKAELRWDQSQAVAESFDCDPSAVPEEFAQLEAELSAAE